MTVAGAVFVREIAGGTPTETGYLTVDTVGIAGVANMDTIRGAGAGGAEATALTGGAETGR